MWRFPVALISGALLACGTDHKSGGYPPPTEPCVGDAQSGEACILGGYFEMGHDPLPSAAELGAYAQYAPRHVVKLSPFFIDEYPVTNAEYKACHDAGGCPDECQSSGACQGGRYTAYHMSDVLLADYPMATATPAAAEAYCSWNGKRLPTEAEWERAARGPNNSEYPWGTTPPDCSQLHCGAAAQPELADPYRYYYPVREGGADVTPEGVHDMVTNVEEAVHDWLDVTYYQKSASENPRGPSAQGTFNRAGRGKFYWVAKDEYGADAPVPSWAREDYLPGGFRCARDGTRVGLPSGYTAVRIRILSGTSTTGGGAQ